MPAPVEFQINILGNATPALAATAKEAGNVDKGMDGAAKATARAEKALEGFGGVADGVNVTITRIGEGIGRFFTIDLATIAMRGVDMVRELASEFVGLGADMVKAAGGAQDLNLALDLKGRRAEVEALAAQFDGLTRFDDDVIKRGVLPLLDVGVGGALLTDLATVAADLETRSAGQQKVAETLQAFQQVALKGEVSSKMLMPLGIGAEEYYKKLGATLNLSVEAAKKAASAGKVQRETLLQALVATVADREGGAIGGAALAGGQTLGASLQRLSDLRDNLLKSVADSPGMQSVQRTIDAFVEFAKGPAGQGLINRIAESIGKMADSVFRFISSEEGQRRITQVLDQMGNALTKIADATPKVLELFNSIDWERVGNVGKGALAGFLGGGLPGAVLGGGIAYAVPTEADGAPQAHDFIWRNGQVINIDPSDDVVGFKKGGSLGMDSLPQSVGAGASVSGMGGHTFGGDTYSITVAGGGGDDVAAKIEQTIEGIIRRREQRQALMLGAA